MARGCWLAALALLAACERSADGPSRPAGYPAHYPLLPGGTAAAAAATPQLSYTKDPNALADELLAALAADGWTITFDSRPDPTAGRLIGARKDGENVIANIGRSGEHTVLVVSPSVAPP